MRVYLTLIWMVVRLVQPATYDIMTNNVANSIYVKDVDGGTSGRQTCSGFNFDDSSTLQKLDSGSVDINQRTSDCVCGGSSNKYYTLVMPLTNAALAGVKTIILTSTPDSTNQLAARVKISISMTNSGYVDICTSCVLGSNDFSAANSNTGLAAFKWLKITWPNPNKLALCEVWAYYYTNYVPYATVSGYGTAIDSRSVVFSSYKTTPTFMCLKDETSNQFYASGPHTCIFNDKDPGNQMTFIVIDFPQPMVIKELHSSGGSSNVFMYIIDPRSNLMQKTAQAMVAAVLALSNPDLATYVSYSSPTGEAKLVFNLNRVNSQSCTNSECQDFGATRVVIANDWNNRDFFTCGFAIMAEELTCPPTANQCLHAIATATTIPSSLTVTALTTETSTSFLFTDNLSSYCATENVCGFTQTFTLSCTNCYTCSSGLSSCGGTCSAASAPAFTYNFLSASGQYQLSVTDDGTQQINHKCYIVAAFNGQSVTSSNQIAIKKTCGTCDTTTYVTTSVPNFPTAIPIGSDGMTAPFTAFTDSVTLCGVTCQDSTYKPHCRLATDTSGPFVVIKNTWLWTGQILGVGSSLNFYAQSLSILNHGVTYTCLINAIQPDSNAMIDSAATFDVSFNMCLVQAQSCPLNYWLAATSAWIQPSSFTVYLDGVPQGTSFIYTAWQDKWSVVCGTGFCGTLNYQFIDTATNLPLDIPSATVSTTVDTTTQVVSLTVSTTAQISAGVYNVMAYGYLDITGVYTGTKPYSYSNSFQITIVDPCTLNNPCQYTQVIDSTQALTTMTIYLDNNPVVQEYDLMDDYISNLCPSVTCAGQAYSLVSVSNPTVVFMTDLATLTTIAGVRKIQAKTTNYLYTGTHDVMIKCTQYGTTGYSLPFQIIVVACNILSCKSTVLTAPVAPAALPASYSIGVDNVAGQTTCALFTNTVGEACTSNPLICGTISYSFVDSTGLTPSFTTLSVGSQLLQTAQTTDVSFNGAHVVKIVASLDMTALGYTKLTSSTSQYTITVNSCSPLPCNYNSIILPSSGLPGDLYVYTNGTTATSTFPSYQDDVSLRCSSPYASLCGDKTYVIEDQSGVPLPFSVNIAYDTSSAQWQIQTSTIDTSKVNVYQLQIHASFNSPPLSGAASDNKLAKFQMIVDYSNQCIYLNCTKNQINMVRSGYVQPSNITIDIEMNWNQTVFDNYNDTKTGACWKQPGSDINGVSVTSWQRPVCGFPIYDVVDMNGDPIKKKFGIPNVIVEYFQDTEYTQQFVIKVRTNLKSLAGEHQVRLSVKLSTTETAQYSNSFYIIVVDPCNPYDCTVTNFLPGLPKPSDIEIAVGQGYVTSKQGLWSNTVSNLCKVTTALCGSPSFVLLMDDLSPVPFVYSVQQSPQNVNVNVIVTDEAMMGQTYNVVLVGFGYNQQSQSFYGQNGTSMPFKVIVATESAINPNNVQTQSPPVFTVFPPNINFITQQESKIKHYSAIAFSQNSTIVEIIVKLNNALLMVDYSLDGTTVSFDINLLNSTTPGTYTVDVKAVDLNGMSVSRSFTITAVLAIIENVVIDTKVVKNTTDPLRASITDISQLGLMTISYNRRVIPVTSIDNITQQDFFIYFEQLSDELPLKFNYTVVGMTPDHVFVQLGFSVPMDVSQGVTKDKVYVYMLNSLFMVEDTEGLYSSWQTGDPIENTTLPLNRTKIRNYGVITNQTLYYPLLSGVPRQLDDRKQMETLQSSINALEIYLKVVMWGSFGMHLIGFGSMEYVWIMFTNLQVISILSAMNLSIPLNFVSVANSYSEIANSIFLPVTQIYNFLKYQASDSEDPSLNIYGQPIMSMKSTSIYFNKEENSTRRLETFEESTYFGKGASDFVIETSAQMIVLVVSLTIVYLVGLVTKLTCYDCFPQNLKTAFEYVRHRVFWNLPLRMLIQQYQCLTFAALLQFTFQKDIKSSTELTVNFVAAIVVIVLYSIGFLIFIFAFIWKNRQQLQGWSKQCDSLFLSVETERKWASVSVGFSLLRKLLLVIAVVTIYKPSMQLFAVTIIQQAYTIYVLLVKPMETNQRNFVEIVNEITLIMIVTLMFTMTEYVPSSSTKYLNGWVIIYMMILQVCFNTVFLLVDLLFYIRRIHKIIRFTLHTRKMKRQVRNHNRVVVNVVRGNKAEYYKRRNPILMQQLDIILSERSDQHSSKSVNIQKVSERQVPLTIKQKKKEFQELMAEMRALDRLENGHEGEWVVSAEREQRRKKEIWNYEPEQDHSRASDWYALPEGYKNSQMVNSISLYSEDSLKAKPSKKPRSPRSPIGMHNLLERSWGEEQEEESKVH